MEQNTSNKIKYLSYIMAIFIVMIHVYNVDTYGLTGAFASFEHFISTLASFAVPTFFAISGYLFFRNYEPKDTLKKWRRRVFGLVIPYLAWNLIGYCYQVLPSYIPALSKYINYPVTFSIKSFFLTLLLGYGVNWFLRCLILFAILSPLFYFLLKNRYIGILVLIASFVLGIKTNYFFYAMFYFYGAYWAMHGKEFVERRYSLASKLVSICLLVGFSIVIALAAFRIPKLMKNAVWLLGLNLVWIAGDILALSKEVPACLGISFFLYVAHDYVLEVLEKGIYILFGKTIYGAAIDYFAAPIIAVALLTAISFLLRRSKFLWRVLAGSRG